MTDRPSPPAAILFDRDGTLVTDVPYNRDPDAVRPMPGAAAALARVRRAGVRTGIVTNQSGVARGLVTPAELAAVNRRVEELLGPFDVWEICPHGEADGCPCRKPRPGLILRAARRLGVAARDCVVIGDIGRDVEAAAQAGPAASSSRPRSPSRRRSRPRPRPPPTCSPPSPARSATAPRCDATV